MSWVDADGSRFDSTSGGPYTGIDADGNRFSFSPSRTVAPRPGNTSAIAIANTTAIQSALTAGGLVQITTPGTYQIAASNPSTADRILSMPSDTTLYLGPGVWLQGPATGTSVVPLIVNSNYRSNKITVSSITCAVSSAPVTGTGTATTATAHGFSVGDYVLIKGDTTGHYNNVWRVDTVPTTTTFTFQMFGYGASPAPAASGTLIAYAANANFKIVGEGGFDAQANTTNTGFLGDLGKMMSIWNKVGDYEISCAFRRAAKYCNYFCNSYRARFNSQNYKNPSDGIHGHGPLYQCQISGVFNSTGDDAVALTAINTGFTQYDLRDSDNAVYASCTKNSDGDIEDVDVQVQHLGNTLSGHVLAMITGGGFTIRRVTARGIKVQNSLGGLGIQMDAYASDTGSFEDIVIDGYAGNMAYQTSMVTVGTSSTTSTINVKNLTLRNLSSHGGDVAGTSTALSAPLLTTGLPTVTINGLTIDNVNVDADLTNWLSGHGGLLYLGSGSNVCTVKGGKLSNVWVKGSGGSVGLSAVQFNSACAWDDFQANNIYMACFNAALFLDGSTQSGTGSFQANNFNLDWDGTNSALTMGNSNGGRSLTCQLTNGVLLNNSNAAFRVSGGTSKTFNLHFTNCRFPFDFCNFTGATSHTINVWAQGVNSDSYSYTSTNFQQTGKMGTTCTWNLRGACPDVGVAADLIARVDGTIFYNTKSTLGTLGAAGLVVGQGTAANSWRLMGDPTKQY